MSAIALTDAAHMAMKVMNKTPFQKSRAAESQGGMSATWASEVPVEKRGESWRFDTKPPGGEDLE